MSDRGGTEAEPQRFRSLLESAIVLAVGTHRGQKDKGGAPYILHPLRVMLSLRDPREMIAGVLHDVVEDGGVTLEQLRHAGFPAEVVEALDALSRRPGESYREYLARVKLADRRDNLDGLRIPEPTEKERRPWEKYRAVLTELERVRRC